MKIRRKFTYELDEIRKKWYHKIMENVNEINKKIAHNLTYYRKRAGLTQAELAEKINYSDKSISKWEQGNGVPDIYILMHLAQLYHVTVNDLIGEDSEEKAKKYKAHTKGLHLLIMLLSSGIVWLIATCAFVALQLLKPGFDWWMIFIYAVAINAVLLIVYASIWKYRLLNFICVTVLIWGSLVCLYLTSRLISIEMGNDYSALWLVFIMGIPLQVLEVLWVFFRSLFKTHKARKSALKNL